VRTTVRGIFWTAGLSLGLFVSVLVILLKPSPHFVSGFFAGLFALLLILNIALGTTCATQLQTRVQKRALPVRRLRKALRVVEQLSSKIQMAQVEIAPATAAQTQAAAVASVSQIPTLSVPPALPGEKPDTGRSWIHAAVFGFLMLGGAISIWAGLQHIAPLRYSAFVLLFLNLLVGLFGLLLQRRFRLSRRPSIVVWISFIAHAVALPTIYFVYSMVYTFQMIKAAGPQGPPPSFTMQMPLSALGDLPGFDTLLMLTGAFSVVLALVGYFAMLLTPGRMTRESTG
jgi:hypothetical protein